MSVEPASVMPSGASLSPAVRSHRWSPALGTTIGALAGVGWNLFGVVQFITSLKHTPESLVAMGMTPAQGVRNGAVHSWRLAEVPLHPRRMIGAEVVAHQDESRAVKLPSPITPAFSSATTTRH